MLVILGVLLIVPFFTSNYIIGVGITIFFFAYFGSCWNLIGGYGGQVSWCHSAFVAIGAYTSLLMYVYLGVSPLISIFVSILIALVGATIIGKVSFRYRGPFFSITTIAFGEIMRVALLYFNQFTGGSAGKTIPYTGEDYLNLQFFTNKPFYYLSLVCLVGIVLFSYHFSRSKMGYYLRAIKDDEDAAISVGIRTDRVKLRAFQLSAMFTAAVGVFYVFYLTYAQPDSICSNDFAVKIGATAIVGGVGTVLGPVAGAFLLIILIELGANIMGAIGGANIIYGIALVLTVKDKSLGRGAAADYPVHRFQSRRGINRTGKGTAHPFAGTQALDDGRIEPTLSGGNAGDITHPGLIGLLKKEVSLE